MTFYRNYDYTNIRKTPKVLFNFPNDFIHKTNKAHLKGMYSVLYQYRLTNTNVT